MGMLEYNNFMKVFSALLRLTFRFQNEKNVDYKTKRRGFFEKKMEKEYAMSIAEYMQKQNILKTKILQELLNQFGIGAVVYNKSQQHYKQDPEFAPKFQKDAASFEYAEHRSIEGTELSKEEAL